MAAGALPPLSAARSGAAPAGNVRRSLTNAMRVARASSAFWHSWVGGGGGRSERVSGSGSRGRAGCACGCSYLLAAPPPSASCCPPQAAVLGPASPLEAHLLEDGRALGVVEQHLPDARCQVDALPKVLHGRRSRAPPRPGVQREGVASRPRRWVAWRRGPRGGRGGRGGRARRATARVRGHGPRACTPLRPRMRPCIVPPGPPQASNSVPRTQGARGAAGPGRRRAAPARARRSAAAAQRQRAPLPGAAPRPTCRRTPARCFWWL
jgi:hypothetical protein